MKSKKVQLIGSNKLQRLLQSTPELCMMQLMGVEQQTCELHGLEQETREVVNKPKLQSLLQKYQEIFAEPTALPPSRGIFDHKIPLE